MDRRFGLGRPCRIIDAQQIFRRCDWGHRPDLGNLGPTGAAPSFGPSVNSHTLPATSAASRPQLRVIVTGWPRRQGRLGE